ncbi:kinase-like protein, partial [Hymenopellis radicata]
DILQAYPHPNIWTHLGFEQTPSSTNMFFEYFPSRTLQEFLAQRGALGFSGMSRHLLGQIISGVAFLHSKDIVHWDLRTDNVFVDNKGCCKISGFAVSKYITSARICTIDPRFRPIRDVRTICGAPECMTHIGEGPPGPAVDIWSVGLIAYEVWMGLKQEDYQEILRCFFKVYLPPPKALRFPILADDFRRGCLAFAPEERFSAERLRHHEYLETTPPV